MDPIVVVLLVVLLLGVIALVVWYGVRAARRQREGAAAAAAALGFRFSPKGTDRFDPGVFPFVRGAKPQHLKNVAWGTWRDRQVTVFDFELMTGSAQVRRVSYFTGAFADLGAALPSLVVGAETTTGRIADRIGMGDIQVGSEPFDRAFSIKSEDPEFARELLSPEVQQWLLSVGTVWRFEVAGRGVVCIANRLDGAARPGMLDALCDFVERIPQRVLDRRRATT